MYRDFGVNPVNLTKPPQALPKEIARREALHDKLDAVSCRLEAQAEARAAAERETFEAKVAAREKRRGSCQGQASEAARRDAGCGRAEQSERPGQPADAQEQAP